MAGRVPGLGVVVGESKKSNKLSKRPGMYINGTKTAGFPQFLLNKIYSQDVFRGIH
jgi:hypothetical protein